MGLRDRLKKREEKREQGQNNLPEGVTRYVRLSQELKDGKDFVILRDPNLWFFYYVHEDGDYATRATYVKKHTCLHSPRKAPETEKEADEMFMKYEKPNGDVCISDKAKAKRGLYFMIPVFDIEYGEWRVLDLKEFHVNNLMDDIEKTEKAARKFDKSYTMIGDVVTFSKADKTYTVGSSDMDEAEAAKAIEAASKLDQSLIDYEELANFRDEADMISILREAADDKVDKSVLPAEAKEPAADTSAEPVADGDIQEDELPF